MLRSRILTAAILIPLVVAGILLAPTDAVALVLGLVVLLGAREWSALAGYRGTPAQAVGMLLAAGGMLGIHSGVDLAMLRPLWHVAAALWIGATLRLVWHREPVTAVDGQRPLMLLLGVLVLLIAWSAVIALHAWGERGPALVMFLFALIWVADSGAYFAGRAFGRRKLSPQVSPGKTWEGVAGALAGAATCGLVLSQLELVRASMPALVLLSLVVAAVSIGGDLFESLLKRQAGMKDSGTLLPGHGGALDRIDSLLAAAPVFIVGVAVLEAGL